MPIHLDPTPTFRHLLAQANRAQVGMWVCSGSPVVAEICATSGLDWLLIDAEHSPNGLEAISAQLIAVHGNGAIAMVRPPVGDQVSVKQLLDLGAQNLLIPMVDTADQAAALVSFMRYPPRGLRGVGSALARASRWNRIESYLDRAEETISLTVQIETTLAVKNVAEIAAVDGVDALFIGPSDLAASMGLLGQQDHPDVIAAAMDCIAATKTAGKKVGINAFAPATAKKYIEAGVDFILVGADVAMLARSSEALADTYIGDAAGGSRTSY
jgi:4-hydroxy-2-oxoheptanedioate aldolase